MFDENNVRNDLLNNYYCITTVCKTRVSASDKIGVIDNVLNDVLNNMDTYNKDELIVVKNIITTTKYMLYIVFSYKTYPKSNTEKEIKLYDEVINKYKSLSKS